MNLLIYAMIAASMVVEYLQLKFSLPGVIKYVPELLSAVAAVVVVVRISLNRFRDLEPRYFAVLLLLLIHITIGIFANHLTAGVIFSGIRFYLKYLPFFLLPLVLPVSEGNLRKQLLVLLPLTLIQLPIAWAQRMATMARGGITGDETVGTMLLSNTLTVYICCVIAVAMAMYLRGRMSMKMLLLFAALTIPSTMINETKGAFILLPLALIIPGMIANVSATSGSIRRGIITLALASVTLYSFVQVYDYFMIPRWGYGLMDFFQMDGRLERYMMKDATVGTEVEVGRVDGLILPFKAAAAENDPMQAILGLGIRNISQSKLGADFTGAEYSRYGNLISSSGSLLIWELGVLGLLLVFTLMYLIMRDAWTLRRAEGLIGTFAVGWVAISVIMAISLFYTNAIDSTALSTLYWLFSGFIVAAARKLRAGQLALVQPPVKAPPRTMETFRDPTPTFLNSAPRPTSRR